MRWVLVLVLFGCGGGPQRARAPMPEAIGSGAVYAQHRQSFVVLRCMGVRYGTGFGFGRVGRIATAAHVVQCPREISAELADGTLIGARVVAVGDLDVALLELVGPRAAEVVPLEMREEPLPVGGELIAIGFPIGPDEDGPNDHTISRGILGQRTRDRLIHDAAISPGSSGGPVLDTEGRVVGVDFAMPGGGGQVALAVPIEHVMELHRQTPANVGDPRDPFEIGVELGVDYASSDDFSTHFLGAELAGWVGAFDQLVGTVRVLILGQFARLLDDGTLTSGYRWAAEVDVAYRLRLDGVPFAFELAGGFSLGFDSTNTTVDELMLEDPMCDPATERCAVRNFARTITTDTWLPRPLVAVRWMFDGTPFSIGYAAIFDVDDISLAEHRFTLRIRFL